MISFLGDILRYLFALVRDLLVVPLLGIFSFVRRLIGEDLVNFAVNLIPNGFKDIFNAIDIAQLASLVSDVAWILPLFAILSIQAAAFSVAGGIRLGRWILALIPTIGG